MKKAHELIDKATKGGTNWKVYQTFQKAFDMQFQAVELFLEKKERPVVKAEPKQAEKKASPKPYQQAKARPEKNLPTAKHAAHKQKKFEKPKVKGRDVELISPEVALIRRFALLHDKTKNKDQVLSFIRALQKAIVEKRIRKTSRFAKTIEDIQKQLVSVHKKMDKTIVFKFDEKDLFRYYKMAGAEVLMPSVRFIKSYIGMQGRDMSKEKAKNLHTRITDALEKKKLSRTDKYIKHIKIILASLESYLQKGKDKPTLDISEAQLNGLEGVLKHCGCHDLKGIEFKESYGSELSGIEEEQEIKPIVTPRNKILNSQEVIDLKSDKLNFSGKWRNFIGNPSRGFTAMIFGKPKFGKSILAIDFAGYLARNHGKVLYIAFEEGFDDTMKDKLQDAAHPNLFVSDYLPNNIKEYNYVFIDSVNKAELSPEDLDHIEKKNPGISFVYVFQTTKDGKAKGSNEYAHNVDVVIEVPERGIATQYGRYNQGGELKIFSANKENSPPPENSTSLSGIKGKKKQKKNSEPNEEEDWTEGPYLYPTDHARLKRIKKLYEEGEMGMAMDLAMSGDTEIRDAIPPDIWLAMGGGLTSTGKEKLRLLLEKRQRKSLEGNMEVEITIETDFEMPLEVLAALLFTKPMEYRIIDKIENEPEEVEEEVKMQVQDSLTEKKSSVKVKAVKFIENDSDEITHGISFLKVTLKGKKEDLEKVAGKDKIFDYKW
ncbi:MAG: hypothetical protein H0W84_01340 [Bacteroidetes bacterium]|nr:hypothetical protein [Bacteroidota bacterium]